MKKIAICLYGRFNNRLDPSSGVSGFEYIVEKVLSKYPNTHVFFHSWDIEESERIVSLYNNKIIDHIFEKQADFKDVILSSNIDESIFTPPGGQSFRTVGNTLSFFYSRKRSIELMLAYQEKSGIIYDSVICCRFDLGQMDNYNGYQPYLVSKIEFNPNFDMNYIYCPYWDQFNIGFPDMWFYSSSTNIKYLSDIYDSTLIYLQRNSKYLNSMISGWPLSNHSNIFSNEIFSDTPQSSLKFDPSEALNNHMLHKWFFYDKNLLSKFKYLKIPSSKFCKFVYSHSDYQDVWPIYFGQDVKHFHPDIPRFIFINKYCVNIPNIYTQIIYDESLSYPERLHSSLEQIRLLGFEVCLYEHEDMILYNDVIFNDIKKSINLVLKPKSKIPFLGGFDCIRLIKSTQNFSIPTRFSHKLKQLLPISRWLFSVQPSIWKINSLIELLSNHKGDSIWELEKHAQKTCRKLFFKIGYLHSSGNKIGIYHFENKIYPYVATAIVKGKWNFSEYGGLLATLLDKYNIDKSIRGTNQ